MKDLQFTKFLHEIETATDITTNTTATGSLIIQQSLRNEMRKKGVQALLADLKWCYGDEFDIVETDGGIVIVAENEDGDFTFSWELKNTIKSLDYDPFLEADKHDDSVAAKIEKKNRIENEKAERNRKIAEKRAKKLSEISK